MNFVVLYIKEKEYQLGIVEKRGRRSTITHFFSKMREDDNLSDLSDFLSIIPKNYASFLIVFDNSFGEIFFTPKKIEQESKVREEFEKLKSSADILVFSSFKQGTMASFIPVYKYNELKKILVKKKVVGRVALIPNVTVMFEGVQHFTDAGIVIESNKRIYTYNGDHINMYESLDEFIGSGKGEVSAEMYTKLAVVTDDFKKSQEIVQKIEKVGGVAFAFNPQANRAYDVSPKVKVDPKNLIPIGFAPDYNSYLNFWETLKRERERSFEKGKLRFIYSWIFAVIMIVAIPRIVPYVPVFFRNTNVEFKIDKEEFFRGEDILYNKGEKYSLYDVIVNGKIIGDRVNGGTLVATFFRKEDALSYSKMVKGIVVKRDIENGVTVGETVITP